MKKKIESEKVMQFVSGKTKIKSWDFRVWATAYFVIDKSKLFSY